MAENRRESILAKVQKLLAKAMATPFEAEADSFRAKANEMMDNYRIEQWEIAQLEAGRAKSALKPVRKDVDITWWWNESGAFGSTLWTMFNACVNHCAIVTTAATVDYRARTIALFGLESDIQFLQMLFTDLYLQMATKIKPKYDPSKSLGYNVYMAKEAGMKYKEICHWIGRPDLIKTVIRYDKRKGYNVEKTEIDGILIREMKKYAAAAGLEVHKTINLEGYVEDFCNAYGYAVTRKLREMREGADTSGDNRLALALRDIRDLSQELLWDEFPDLRPHPEDCQCENCHTRKCRDPKCTRPRCVEKRKPIRYSKARSYYRDQNPYATARGAQAGREARIMGKNDSLGNRKSIDK